ncbi:MAG: response regulator [Candidatus Omnitrophota bacterium]
MLKKKILVVDDERDFLNLIRIRLESSKYEVITACDGVDALLKFDECPPDAVMLDILMPNMDGLEVLKKIRAKDKNIPIFIITAFSNEERLKLAKELNVNGFMDKTADLKTEIEHVAEALGK